METLEAQSLDIKTETVWCQCCQTARELAICWRLCKLNSDQNRCQCCSLQVVVVTQGDLKFRIVCQIFIKERSDYFNIICLCMHRILTQSERALAWSLHPPATFDSLWSRNDADVVSGSLSGMMNVLAFAALFQSTLCLLDAREAFLFALNYDISALQPLISTTSWLSLVNEQWTLSNSVWIPFCFDDTLEPWLLSDVWTLSHHHHHHQRISSRRKSWRKLQGRCERWICNSRDIVSRPSKHLTSEWVASSDCMEKLFASLSPHYKLLSQVFAEY